MKLQKTVMIQEGYEEDPSVHYEAPRDKEKLLKIPRTGMYTYKCRVLLILLFLLLSKTSVGFCSILIWSVRNKRCHGNCIVFSVQSLCSDIRKFKLKCT
jgi:hypothetical protein